jgi:hypothetical protein
MTIAVGFSTDGFYVLTRYCFSYKMLLSQWAFAAFSKVSGLSS